MPTPVLFEKLGSKLGHHKKLIDALFFVSITVLAVCVVLLKNESESIWLMFAFASSGYLLMWSAIFQMVISCFDVNFEQHRTFINKFLAMPNRNGVAESKLAQWFSSLFFSFFMFGLFIFPFFGIFVWLMSS
ncbi:hypothetical protein [Thalassotalea sp. PP2-459]|uniref:hypothetical protein n=1 Tax=Thalassotalea sp. PP2-459 TaxID=1742724 RepID=UPI000942F74F|nr:hypothetical protein [Thalassotalea sp. PP2-459]OKY25786.1 hypothetical protein BI291_14335 [Thalassotalea sp. PP2-459]